ncbi:MAG TPA: hypothetical protein DCS07_07115 [Bdellovibrionales bacterium]|nr:MAG: transcriptional regulator [Bdellovibrionales bacterium GWB1_52_6]OFZ06278.1 MAG: transcriptional regulator [Bdellovibrionales bacterium GWA1_52_35]OFZ36125.1 MAG: transcriptional regulator [Bdellovibrionales bacterium GWC1_52_8]HAR42389.1 hypothetical protein [Bdellovibrionales bacterium]HCM40027.1 hypothetical protein [Bdellovibrionales bacterium]
MGAQWKHAGRIQNSSKRGALFSKLAKEIIVAAKAGGAQLDGNSRLRSAVEAAKKASLPRENIERAIKRGAGLDDEPVIYELVTYEGFALHKVPIIVECLTDNKNRTAADIRSLFRKAQLGNPGSVAWMFDRMGVIEGTHVGKDIDFEGAAIEAGAQNVEALEASEVPAGQTGARFFCDTTDLDTVTKALIAQGWVTTMTELSYIAKNNSELSDEQKKEVTDFLEAIDDHDDVHRIYVGLK